MVPAFGISVSLLAALLLFRAHEGREHRYARAIRRALDRYAASLLSALHRVARFVFRFTRSDVLMRGLHVVTYGALLCVRYTERKLVSLVRMLRRFRREQEQRAPSHHLAAVQGTEESSDKE